jgi:hypothetical protein
MDVNQLEAAGFSTQTGVMCFVVHFVKYKSDSGKKVMIRLRTISVGIHLLEICYGVFRREYSCFSFNISATG